MSLSETRTQNPVRRDRSRPGHHLASALMAWLLLLGPGASQAHPHAWIDLKVEVIFNEQGAITALRQHWLMDTFYSVFILEEMAEDARGETEEERLQSIAEQIIRNLTDYDFFTEIRHGGEPVNPAGARSPSLNWQESRLKFSFEMLIDPPIRPDGLDLEYAVFDPTYYVEVLHDELKPIHLDPSHSECQSHLARPRPDPAVLARAAMLDIGQTGDPGMGRHFAERVSIRCAP